MNSFRKAIPELSSIRTACIIDGIPFTLGEQFEALEISALSVGKNNVTNDLVADCQRRGIQLWTWTVNNKTYMERLLVSKSKRGQGYRKQKRTLLASSDGQQRRQDKKTKTAAFGCLTSIRLVIGGLHLSRSSVQEPCQFHALTSL